MAQKTGRNDPCHCGSGKKYKHCHAGRERALGPMRKLLIGVLLIAVVGSLVVAFNAARNRPDTPDRVWDPAHGHYHDR
jgi:hypothetical protein